MAPEDIVFREVESESVIIQWTVAYISYSPETYVVQYGTSRETLVHNSSRRASEVGTTTYSVPLSGLRDNTTYYVQVLATNTALKSSRSSVESFTTLSAMEIVSGVCRWLLSVLSTKTSAGQMRILLCVRLCCTNLCTHVLVILTFLEGCLISFGPIVFSYHVSHYTNLFATLLSPIT